MGKKDKKKSEVTKSNSKRKAVLIAGIILVASGLAVWFVLPDTPDTTIVEEKKDWVFPIDTTDVLPENPDCTEDETVSPDGDCIPKMDFPLDLYVEPEFVQNEVVPENTKPEFIEPDVRELTVEEKSHDLPQSVLDMILFLNDQSDFTEEDMQILMNYAVQAEKGTIDEETENKARQIFGKMQ